MGVSSPHTAVTRPGRFKIQWWWGVVILLTQVITIMKRVQIMQFLFFIFFLKIGRTSTFLRVFTIISKDSSSDEKLIGVQWSTVSLQKHSKMHDWTSETYKRWGCTFFSCLKACVRGDFYCEPAGKEWHYLRIKISFCIYDASTPPGGPPKIFVKT